ncbi:MAG: hypothetical protein NT025_00095, partial [bacterium]|nr:hypothetical protein [bacterium]
MTRTGSKLTYLLRCVAAMASLAVGACGSEQGSAPPSTTPDPARTLIRALGGEPATLDPHLAEDIPALALSQELF